MFLYKLIRGQIQAIKGLIVSLRSFLVKLRTLYAVLPFKVKMHLLSLEALSVCGTLVGILSLFSAVPFFMLVAAPDRIMQNKFVIFFMNFTGVEEKNHLIIMFGAISLCFLALFHALNYLFFVLRFYINREVIIGLRTKMAEYYLVHLPYVEHSTKNRAIIMDNVMSKTGQVVTYLVKNCLSFFRNVLLLLIYFFLLLSQNVFLSFFFAFLFFAILLYQIVRNNQTLRAHLKRKVEVAGTVRKDLHDALTSLEDITILNRGDFFPKRIKQHMLTETQAELVMGKMNFLFRPVIEIVAYFCIYLIIVLYVLFFSQEISLTSLALFGLVLFRALPPISQLYSDYLSAKQGVAYFDFIREDMLPALVCDVKSRMEERYPFVHNIEFRELTYSYPKTKRPAFSGANLTISRGSSVGFCGSSGSGKSTLIKTFLGLLEPTEGEILVDGKKLGREDMLRWRNLIGYVPQTINIIDDTIAANVALAIPDAEIDRGRVETLLRSLRMGEFLDQLPLGVDAPVSDAGALLSGGQRQRLVIARALYRNPEIVVFDEATSAVDMETEREIIELLTSMGGEKTLLIVTHRISTIASCDKICFMKDGRIQRQGSYGELLRDDGDFRKLVSNE